jgi:hypothetical protein
MANNTCLIILIVILVVGIIWFLNQPKPFMRLRHKKVVVGGKEPKLGDQQMGCCELDSGIPDMGVDAGDIMSYKWLPKDQCNRNTQCPRGDLPGCDANLLPGVSQEQCQAKQNNSFKL